jgi:hypothetical protein
MPNIIRERNAVRGAPMEDLNYTYRVLKEEPNHPGFGSRAAAEIQVGMAIMAAQDAVGRAGVPKGVQPVALTPAEIRNNNPYKEGTMSHALKEAIDQQKPIEPRPKAAEKPEGAKGRLIIKRVKATFAGESRPQAGSVRSQVLQFVQNAPDNTCTVEALEEHFKQPVRGYLQKLVEKNHLAVVEE